MTIADLPDQEQDTLESLLIDALDGDDQLRIALVLRRTFIQFDEDRDADLARIRASGVQAVVAL